MDIFCDENAQNIREIILKNNSISFYEVNVITKYRNDTFFNKEPETLNWIDEFDKKENFWDVGANVGLYSIYAGKTKNCNVTAIEPSVFNLELLAKNIYLNSLHNTINILPLSLSDKPSMGIFHNTSILNGAALSSLHKFNKSFQTPENTDCLYKIPILTLDSITSMFNIEKPKYLKIDVDGLEYEILLGANQILKNVDSILIEIDENDKEKSLKISSLLQNKKFKLDKEGARELGVHTVNQIWKKT
ncbi:FkbM family methyltransferase [Pseudomonadota bacterium]|nr:FkbM family methyltransferase [Pseudomonadota bacterium]